MSDKFCVNCKHSRGEGDRMTCESPNNAVPNVNFAKYLVTGIDQPVVMAIRGASCVALRTNNKPEINEIICAPDGKWFEQKDEK